MDDVVCKKWNIQLQAGKKEVGDLEPHFYIPRRHVLRRTPKTIQSDGAQGTIVKEKRAARSRGEKSLPEQTKLRFSERKDVLGKCLPIAGSFLIQKKYQRLTCR